MSRLIFAALTSLMFVTSANAQQVAGRDLLTFPLGVLADAPPLSMQMMGGIWNPAATSTGAANRAGIGVAELTTPQEQGVSLSMVGGLYSIRPGTIATLSVAQASVSDILRTDTDPQSQTGEIPYQTTVLSAGASQTLRNVTFGFALRYRLGTADVDHASEVAADGGVIVDHVFGTPVRVAASTFLFSPWNSTEVATYMAAADLPLYRRDTTFSLRGGYSFSHTKQRQDEHYLFATSTFQQLDLSAGIARTLAYGTSDRRWRLGCGFRHASYRIAIGREDGAAGFGASYQFLLTRVIR